MNQNSYVSRAHKTTLSKKNWVAALCSLMLASSGAMAAQFDLSWAGANGYAMDGAFSFSDSLAGTGPITAKDLASFSITAYQNNTVLGSWDALQNGLADGFNFNFNFDAATNQFLVGGFSASQAGQDWNTVTGGGSCPSQTIGFSSGSGGQVLCVAGSLISASMIDVSASTLSATAVPEASTYQYFVIGLFGLGYLRRKFAMSSFQIANA